MRKNKISMRQINRDGLLLGLFLLCAINLFAQKNQYSNIVFILVDDIGYESSQFYTHYCQIAIMLFPIGWLKKYRYNTAAIGKEKGLKQYSNLW